MTWDLPHAVRRYVRHDGRLYQAAVDEAVRLLKSSSSIVPVDTGRLKRRFRRKGRGLSSRIYNPQKYASFVEAGIPQPLTRNAVKLTLAVGAPQILGRLGRRVSWNRTVVRRASRKAVSDRNAIQARVAADARVRLRDIEAKGLAARPQLRSDVGRRRRPTGRVRHLLAKPRWTRPELEEVLELIRLHS